MKRAGGFALTELVISIGVLGIVTTAAFVGYNYYLPKAQVNEAISMLNGERLELGSAIRTGKCPVIKVKGKYGSLASSGTFAMAMGHGCPSGCEMAYTFNGSGVHKDLASGVVAVSMLNNGATTLLDKKTSVQAKLLGNSFSTHVVDTAANCATVTATIPVLTSGSDLSTTETGMTLPAPDPAPSGGTGGGASPSTPPAGGGTAGSGSSGGTSGEQAKVTSLIIDRTYLGTSDIITGYYAKRSVNLYDFFVSRMGRAPEPSEDVRFTIEADVALIGKADIKATSSSGYAYLASTRTSGGVMIDSRWKATNTIRILNKGVIAGFNGIQQKLNDAKHFPNVYMNGGDAISNASTAKVEITNKGVIGGGGGAATNNPGARVVYYGPYGAPTNTSLFLGNSGSGYYHRSGGLGEHGEKHGKQAGGVPGYVVAGNPVTWVERGDLRGR